MSSHSWHVHVVSFLPQEGREGLAGVEWNDSGSSLEMVLKWPGDQGLCGGSDCGLQGLGEGTLGVEKKWDSVWTRNIRTVNSSLWAGTLVSRFVCGKEHDLGGQETKTSPSSARPAFTGCVLRADRVSGIWEYVDDNCGPCLEESSLYSSWSCVNSPICPFQL